jgi:hypothetical protein
MLEALHEKSPVRQSGQGVVERDLQCSFGRREQIRARVGVQQVGGGHVG